MSFENLISDFQSKFSTSFAPIFDGKIHRFGEKDVFWYAGHMWNFNKKDYHWLKVGNWKTAEELIFKSYEKAEESKNFRKKFIEMNNDLMIKLDAEKTKKHEDCKQFWFPKWLALPEKTDKVHPYIERKMIENFGTKVDEKKNLIIPIYDENGFVGVQKIDENGNKKFSFGIKMKGSFCPLSNFDKAEYVFLSEGFATASSVQMAFPEVPSIACMNAYNICDAISSIRAINPNVKIIICADKDKNGIGERYAKKATQIYTEVIYKIPKFVVDNSDLTDFNDLHVMESLEKVKEQLTFSHNDFEYIEALGYNENFYYYTSSSNKQIIALSSSAHSKINFLSMATIEYFLKKHGFENEKGKIVVSWDNLASELMMKCRNKGIFNFENIRGVGVWEDNLINDGEKLFPEKPVDARYFYQKLPKIKYDLSQEMNDEDADQFAKSFLALNFKNNDKNQARYLLAWIVQAQIFSVLNWRFHVWVIGSRGTGKSTILNWISKLHPNALLTSNATASGIVQYLKNDAKPVIYDEAEAGNGRIDSIIELARQMNAQAGHKTLRGSPTGKSFTNNTNTVFCMGSIQPVNLNTADASRFLFVELASTENQNQELFKMVEERVEYTIANKHAFFARCFKCIPVIKKAFITFHEILREELKMEARISDQLATFLACTVPYIQTTHVSKEQAMDIIKQFDLKKNEFIEENKIKDNEDCLQELLDCHLTNQNDTVGNIIVRINTLVDSSIFDRIMESFGLRYYKDTKELFISKNALLEQKMKKYPNYTKILRRSEHVLKINDVQKVNGNIKKGIRLKLDF